MLFNGNIAKSKGHSMFYTHDDCKGKCYFWNRQVKLVAAYCSFSYIVHSTFYYTEEHMSAGADSGKLCWEIHTRYVLMHVRSPHDR